MEHRTELRLIKASKSLSWILRHGAIKEGLSMDSSGYVKVSDLLQHPKFASYTLEDINFVVLNNNKKRFALKEDQGELYIRATQGHSINVLYTQTVSDESLLTPITNPENYPIVIHGTYKSSWASIQKQGLFRMKRNHIRMIYFRFCPRVPRR